MRTVNLLAPAPHCTILLLALATLNCGCGTMNSYAMNETGTAYYRRGQYELACNEFRRAVLDDPTNPNYHYNLATSLKRRGQVADAEKVYRRALDLDPAHQPSYHGLAMLLNEQSRQADARQLLESWAATQPYASEPHIETAWLQRETGDTASAEDSLRTALKIQPRHPVALAQLGQLYEEAGQPDRAVAMYQRSLHQRWNQPKVQSRLASVSRAPGRKAPMTRYAAQPRSRMRPYQPQMAAIQTRAPQGIVYHHTQPAWNIQPAGNGIAYAPVDSGIAAPSQPMTAAIPITNDDPAHVPQWTSTASMSPVQ
jgi:Flp pilus assembly protein TadD